MNNTVATREINPPKTSRLVMLFVAFALAVPLVGLATIKLYGPQVEQEAYANLQAVAELKAGQIDHWLDERHGDGLELAASTGFSRQIEQLAQNPTGDAQLLKEVENRLASLHTAYGYDSLILLDVQERVLASVGNDVDIPTELQALVRDSLSSGKIVHNDLYRDNFGRLNMDWVAPIVISDRRGARMVAAVVLRVVPGEFLYPLIQTWPTSSASAETMLVRKEGDTVLFLNELRHRQNTALTLRLPLNQPDFSAATAVADFQPGTVEGKDYRGVQVLAAYRPVPGTNWRIIAKVDREEVLAPLRLMAFLISIVASFAIAIVSAAVVMLWRQQNRTHALELQHRANAMSEESERRFRAVTQSANDAIVNSDSAGRIVNWNPGAERLFGYSEAEINGKLLTLLLPERYRDAHLAGLARVAAGGEAHVMGKTVELAGLHKDGSEFPLELSLSKWKTASGLFFTAIIRDITVRKQAEDALFVLARRAEALLELPRASEQLDEVGFMQRGQELAEDLTGSQIAFIHFVNDDEESIELVTWSRRTLEHYCHAAFDRHYPVRDAGIWADALRQRQPVMFNDYVAYPNKHGLPEGHSALTRLISVPVIENGKVVMLTGVGNKATDYTDLDVETVQLISNDIWRIVQRRRMDKKLAQFSRAIEGSFNEIYMFDSETLHFVDVNLGARTNLGYTLAELEDMTPLDIKQEFSAESFNALLAPLRSRNEHYLRYQTTHRRKDNSIYPVETHLELTDGSPAFFVAVVQDITGRKANEARIGRLTQLYAALSQCSQAIVRSANEEELFPQICCDAVKFGGMKMAWIGLVDESGKQVSVAASCGDDKDYLSDVSVSLDANEVNGRGPSGIAIRENRPYWCQDFQLDPNTAPWHESAALSGWKASAALPLCREGRVIGCLTLYADAVNAFDEDARKLLEEMASNINFALDNFAHEARRKQLDMELAENEVRLRTLVGTIPDLIWLKNADGVYLSCNPMFEHLVGITEANIIGKTDYDLVDKEMADSFRKYDRIAMTADKPCINEEWVVFADTGRRTLLETLKTPMHDKQGRLIGVLGIARDITERRKAEESLRQLSLAVEQSPNSIVITDLDAKIEYANNAFSRATGYSLAEVIGQNPRILQSGKTPKETYAAMWAHLTRGDIWKGELINWRKDGSEFIESMLISPVRQADGRVTHYLGIAEDITLRKQAEVEILKLNEELEEKVMLRTAELAQANSDISRREEEIRSVVNHMLDCVLTIDERGIVRSANPAVAKIFGYSHEEVIGQNIAMLMPEPDHSAHDSYLTNYIRTDRPRVIGIGREIVGKHKNGEIIALELSVSEYYVQGYRYFTGILRDIRERKRIMADLEQARLNAEQANRAKSNFLAAMSHEIRTPMNGVIGMIDVLQQSSLDNAQTKMANVIHDSAFALLAVIDDILDFSKIEAGKLNIESVPMNIDTLVEGVCETLNHMALKKDVELTLFVDPALHSDVLGDPVRVRQILINLANNAIKFSCGQGRQARVSVRVTQKPTARPGEQVIDFCVTDNGIGIDDATQARLFSPFTQADSTTTRTFGGTGLGLAISRQLANMMHGEISVRSAPDKGAEFTVRLPFAILSADADTERPPALLAGLSCLVVGDAQTIASDLVRYLAHDGAQVTRVDDTDAAQRWIGQRPAGQNVVIVDIVSRTTSPPEELLVAAHARPDLEVRFVVIGRGRRRGCRLEADGDISVDANIMSRRTFLKAVALAAGKVVDQSLLAPPDWAKTTPIVLTPMSREEARRAGRLILIAEDNAINQKVIQHQLTLLGQTADMADNGSEALARWQSGDYAILITDLHMPKMDGYALTEAIRAAESVQSPARRIPIIAFTANALKEEPERCRSVGMDDYLSKPVQLTTLKAMLEKWLPAVAEAAPDLPTPAATPVDVNVLKALVGDDAAIIAEFLHDFRISADKIALELRSAITHDNPVMAGAAAHKLKSSARSVGALALGDLCAKMERLGKTGQGAELALLMPAFEAEVQAVCCYLDSY